MPSAVTRQPHIREPDEVATSVRPPSNSALVETHRFDTELRRQGKPKARSADRVRPAVHATSRECDFVKLTRGLSDGLSPESPNSLKSADSCPSAASEVLGF